MSEDGFPLWYYVTLRQSGPSKVECDSSTLSRTQLTGARSRACRLERGKATEKGEKEEEGCDEMKNTLGAGTWRNGGVRSSVLAKGGT